MSEGAEGENPGHSAFSYYAKQVKKIKINWVGQERELKREFSLPVDKKIFGRSWTNLRRWKSILEVETRIQWERHLRGYDWRREPQEEPKAILVTKMPIENERLSHSDVCIQYKGLHYLHSWSLHHAREWLGSELVLTKD